MITDFQQREANKYLNSGAETLAHAKRLAATLPVSTLHLSNFNAEQVAEARELYGKVATFVSKANAVLTTDYADIEDYLDELTHYVFCAQAAWRRLEIICRQDFSA